MRNEEISACAVKMIREKVIIPTYMPYAPDKNPIFYEKRAYQGASGRIYPLPVTDRLSHTKVDKEYDSITLENEYIRIMVLPEIGGRIHIGLDKTNNYDFIYHNTVIKPALIGIAGAWISGGIEFNWPQHHRPTTFMPLETALEENADGSKTVWVGETEPLYGLKSLAGITVYPGRSYLKVKVRVSNPTPFPQPFMWWANLGVHCNENYRIVFPQDINYLAYHDRAFVSEWPIVQDGLSKQPDTRFDGSWFKNHMNAGSFMAMDGTSKYDFIGGYDIARNAGTVHVADHHVAPGKKLFTWGNGEFAHAWENNLTDEDGSYLELMTGVYTDNQPDFSWLQPNETRTFEHIWYPVRDIGLLKNASCDAAISMELTQDNISVGFYATGRFSDSVVSIKAGNKLLYEHRIEIDPAHPCLVSMNRPENIEDSQIEAAIRSEDGKVLASFRPEKGRFDAAPPPRTPSPEPSALKLNEELYIHGLHSGPNMGVPLLNTAKRPKAPASFQYKMLFSFVGLAVLACLCVGLVSYLVSYNLQVNSVRTNYSQLLSQVSEGVDWKLQSVENAAKQMSLDINLQKILEQTTQGYGSIEFQQYISRYSVSIINVLPVDCRVEVYVTNETLPERYINTSISKASNLPARWMDILHFSRLQAYPWNRQVTVLTQKDMRWLQVGDDAKNGTITYVDNVYDMNRFLVSDPQASRLALLLFNTNLSGLVDIAPMQEEGKKVSYSIIDSSGMEIYSSSTSSTSDNNAGREGKIRLQKAIPRMGMTLEAYVPTDNIYLEARKTLFLSLASTLGFMAVFSAIALLLSRYFSRRIRTVVEFINTVRDGEFKNRLKVSPKDELYLVSMALNDMTETIDSLVEQVYLANLERTQAQLDLLQLQINPHLLYNSLSSVGNMIQLGMREKAIEVIIALTSFYRLSLSSGKTLILLSEELEHVKAYIKVRSIQFSGDVDVTYDIALGTERIAVPKIILQPLVENVFKHAVRINVPISIRISSVADADKLIICVNDNGAGMDQNMVDRLNMMKGEGAGIKNVFQRIRLQFGEGFGGKVISRSGEGTLVELVLPCPKL